MDKHIVRFSLTFEFMVLILKHNISCYLWVVNENHKKLVFNKQKWIHS